MDRFELLDLSPDVDSHDAVTEPPPARTHLAIDFDVDPIPLVNVKRPSPKIEHVTTIETARTVGLVTAQDASAIGRDARRADGNVSSAHALRAAADLAWEPEIVPLMAGAHELPPSVGRAVVRSDTRAPIGVVGKRYTTIGNGVLFDMADALAGASNGALRFGNAGHKSGGARPFVQLSTAPRALGRDARFERVQNISLFTSHDGSLCLTAGFSDTIIVCRNTYRHALKDAHNGLKVRHTAGAEELMSSALEIVKAAQAAGEAFDSAALAMMGTGFSDRSMLQLASVLVPGEGKRGENARGEMMRAWYSAPGAMPGTEWGAAQAVTYYTSHTLGSADARDESAIFGAGTGADLEGAAWWHLTTAEGSRALETVKVLRS